MEAERIRRSSRLSAILLPLLEHYKEGRASWVFDMKSTFKIDEKREHGSGPSVSPVDFPIFIFYVNAADRGIVNDWDKKAMLVSDVHFVQGPNGVIPSTVGLYLAYEESEKLRGGDVYLQVRQRTFKMICCRVNGELCIPPFISPDCSLRGDQSRGRFKPNVIQSALQIVDGISDDCSEIVSDIPSRDACKIALDTFASSTRIYVNPDGQPFFQAVNARFKFRDVLVGPFDFQTGTFADRHQFSPIAL